MLSVYFCVFVYIEMFLSIIRIYFIKLYKVAEYHKQWYSFTKSSIILSYISELFLFGEVISFVADVVGAENYININVVKRQFFYYIYIYIRWFFFENCQFISIINKIKFNQQNIGLPSSISRVTFGFLREKKTSPHLKSTVLLDSSASTGINGNPKALSPVNTPRAEELPSLSSKWFAEY
uniref:7TM_GPCR_Srx domain-containing protein n=1 Tax=Heterorhabditis bacteriophora TaxID=37862 RepID=A0A1I7WC97_HETBA